MNISTGNQIRSAGILAVALVTALVVTSCATAPSNPAGSAEVRSKLDLLEAQPNMADLVPGEIREAEAAVTLAEQPVGKDIALGEYRVYMADRKVAIAAARASTLYAEAQRPLLSQARDEARLDARTREADKAHRKAEAAQSETEAAEATAAVAAADAAKNAQELQRQIDMLEAEATNRGLVLTLGDVLFATGKSNLNPGDTSSLDKLVVFLDQYPDRDVAIEGHTDDVGSADMNQVLSQHRADSVKSYLVQQGIRAQRISASGLGESQPVANNQTATGRQQNRRVEVIIENPPATMPTASTN